MERLAPLEIDLDNLKIGIKGYDKSEVSILFNRFKTEIAGLVNELNSTKEELEQLKASVKNYADQENTVKDTLLIAQKAAEETRLNAQREAEAVVAKAHRTAEETQRQYQAKINDLRWELERMRMDRQKFANDFRAQLEGYLRGLTEDTVLPSAASNGNGEASEAVRAVVEAQVS